MISSALFLYQRVKVVSPLFCALLLRKNPLSKRRAGRCGLTSFKLKGEPRNRNISPSTYCFARVGVIYFIFSRARMIQSALSWINWRIEIWPGRPRNFPKGNGGWRGSGCSKIEYYQRKAAGRTTGSGFSKELSGQYNKTSTTKYRCWTIPAGSAFNW